MPIVTKNFGANTSQEVSARLSSELTQTDSCLSSSLVLDAFLPLGVGGGQRVVRFSVSVLHARNRRAENCSGLLSNTAHLLSTESKFPLVTTAPVSNLSFLV